MTDQNEVRERERARERAREREREGEREGKQARVSIISQKKTVTSEPLKHEMELENERIFRNEI